MKRTLSLSARIFLFSFPPMCLALVASFLTINMAIKWRIKEGLVESLQRMEKVLASASADYHRRSNQLLTILSENAGLKAGIGLLREVPLDNEARAQVYQTIEAQLREVGSTLDYDLLLVADSLNRPVAGLLNQGRKLPLDSLPTPFHPSRLLSVQGTLYETTTLPINLGAENLGSLTVGRKFNLSSLHPFDKAALMGDHRILLTSFPSGKVREIEDQLRRRCGQDPKGCEIEIGGETHLALPVEPASLGANYQLLAFQSIDAAMDQFTHGFKRVFLLISVGGIVLVLLLSAFVSHSISRPLLNLVAGLQESERTGQLRTDFSATSPAKEVNQLAEAFNRAAKAAQESQDRLDEAYLQFIETMAQALDARDPYTAGHSDRVSVNATTIAQAMELSPRQLEIIRTGSKLHDIGKIGVPDGVLQKPGRLTEEEFALIKLHPQIGKRILEKVGRFQDYLPIVELHHENHDGSGYPYGLRGERIPLGVRIVHVADVYDAVTSGRAYRKAMSEQQAWELLESGSGSQFDPEVVETFLSILRIRKVLDELFQQASLVLS